MRLYDLVEITVIQDKYEEHIEIKVLKSDMPDIIMAQLLRALRNQGFGDD